MLAPDVDDVDDVDANGDVDVAAWLLLPLLVLLLLL